MNAVREQSLFDEEEQLKQALKQEKKQLQKEQETKKKQILQDYESLKKDTLENLKKDFSAEELQTLEQEFEGLAKNIFQQKMMKSPQGKEALRNKFISNKFLPDHLQSEQAYLKYIQFSNE